MIRYLRGERPPRLSVPRPSPLAGLRQAAPAAMSGPVNPDHDPCGAPPIPAGLPEDTRRSAITTLIATAARYLK